jgi:hypothetical protein
MVPRAEDHTVSRMEDKLMGNRKLVGVTSGDL